MAWSILHPDISVLFVPINNTNTPDQTTYNDMCGNITWTEIEMIQSFATSSISAWRGEAEAEEDECAYDHGEFSSLVYQSLQPPLGPPRLR